VANGSNIVQMLLVTIIDDYVVEGIISESMTSKRPSTWGTIVVRISSSMNLA